MNNCRFTVLLFVVGMVLLSSSMLQARTKLVALPDRDAVSIRLDNPAATLVQEERTLTLQEGANQIDFSWKGVQIDPDSIRIQMLSHPEEVTLLSVSYPPNENALVWNIHSAKAWEEKVRISYLLDRIDRLVTYKAVANQDESQVNLKSFLVLRNFSGEDFPAAKCVLNYGEPFDTGIKHQETKRIKFFQKKSVPVAKEYTWDAAEKPHDPDKQNQVVGIPLEYVIKNNAAASLGEHPLWNGKARIYQKDGHDSTIFLGEDLAEFTPVGDKMKLYVGDSRDIVVTQRRLDTRRTNIRRNDDNNITVYDEEIHDRVKIENFKDEAVTLTVVEYIPGQWEPMEFSHDYERENHKKLKFHISLAAGEEKEVNMRYRRRNIFAQQFRQFNEVRR